MNGPMWYPTAEDVHAVHDEALARFPESHDRPGIRSPGAIEHIVREHTPPADDASPDPIQTAAALLRAIAGAHAYHAGNKRTAFYTAIGLLKKNGHEFQEDSVAVTAYMRRLTHVRPSEVEIAEWLRKRT